MNVVQASTLVLTVALCLGACSRREPAPLDQQRVDSGTAKYVPFDQQGVVSGMTKVEAIAKVKALGFKVKDDTKLDEGYSMVDATYGEQLWILGFCEGRLALTSSLVPTNRERMDKFLASYTRAYGKPNEKITTIDRSQPEESTEDFVKRAVFGPQNDVTLTWQTPYGTAEAAFDHAADQLGLELTDNRVWQPCARQQ